MIPRSTNDELVEADFAPFGPRYVARKIRRVFTNPLSVARTAASMTMETLDHVHFLLTRRFARKEVCSLAILDDVFPNRLSTFRLAEFNAYLEHFPGSKVYTRCRSFTPGKRLGFAAVHQDYSKHYPQWADRIQPFSNQVAIRPDAFYLLFLSNAYDFLPIIEEARRPFVMTLNPGGGFQRNDPRSDYRLRRVTSSRFFAGVISTQRVTRDYLLEKGFCRESQIHDVFGGLFPLPEVAIHRSQKDELRRRQSGFNICFVAHKYMPLGRDKGYPAFIEFAHQLAKLRNDVTFHVVGGFDREEIDVTELGDRIRFYGLQKMEFFPSFHAEMDMIISPNIPNVLLPGAFDGFPTGCCIDAALHGVALFCTDKLGLNPGFRAHDEVVIISDIASEIVTVVQEYLSNPQKLSSLQENGRLAMERAFSYEKQVAPRIALLAQLLPQVERTMKVATEGSPS